MSGLITVNKEESDDERVDLEASKTLSMNTTSGVSFPANCEIYLSSKGCCWEAMSFRENLLWHKLIKNEWNKNLTRENSYKKTLLNRNNNSCYNYLLE